MQRRNRYSRNLFVPTSAARIAVVRNNRETLLLAKTNRALSFETNCTVRAFYEEKSRAYCFLQKAYDHGQNYCKARDEDGLAVADRVTSEATSGLKSQRMGLPTLNNARARAKNEEHRLQKALPKDSLGFLSKDRENEQSNERKTEHELEETTSKNVKLQDHRNTNRPFKVRSRVSGICFACTQLHLQNSPGMDLAKLPE